MDDLRGDIFKAAERVLNGTVSKVLSEYTNRQDPNVAGTSPQPENLRGSVIPDSRNDRMRVLCLSPLVPLDTGQCSIQPISFWVTQV